MFSRPDSNVFILHGEYSTPIILLSIVIACGASYTALTLNQRVIRNSFFHQNFWLILSAIAMGLGIWSMHFVGMSAFMLPIDMSFDLLLTLLSIVPAVLASFVAFSFANRKNSSNKQTIVAGLLMGMGISSMHYIGMAAMKMEASFYYKPVVFIVSVLIAVVVSFVAMFVFSKLQTYMSISIIKIVTSTLMGLAISSMHYTGMAAVVFYVDRPIDFAHHTMHSMDMVPLIITVTLGIAILLFISGLTGLLDRYVDNRLNSVDSLTLMPNQNQFESDMDTTKSFEGVAVLHIHNLEKWISSFGYKFADKIAAEIAETIQRTVPVSFKAYRIEGNRFAVMAVEQDFTQLQTSMEEILSYYKRPFVIDDHQILIEMVSAIAPPAESVRETFSNCMAVLNHPSIIYKHEVIHYDSAIHTYSFERQIIEDIEGAMANNDLLLVYQPKVCLRTEKTVGVEALLRWRHPELGLISPGLFIPILESNRKSFDVTDWVIREVCRQVREWLDNGIPFKKVSINIPGPYVTSSRLLKVIEENLATFNIESRYLELEITETSVIHEIEHAITAVGKLRELGLSVALDDFGTGLSSLSYLRRIPISTIKVDKSFVDGIPKSEKDSDVLKAIITLCYSLKLDAVIEGIETKEQIDLISEWDDRPIIQGYYFSRPLEAKDLAEWVRKSDLLQIV